MHKHILLYIISLFSIHAFCIEKDTLSHFLEDLVITSERNISPLKSSDTRVTKMDMKFMQRLPKIFGNADPLHYTQMLPGIQTNAEYDAGLHIQGCDNSHNMISIAGVPIYNASHLLGFFSTFIPSHFPRMSITKNATASEGYSCIGGIMNMELNENAPEKLNGEFAVGAMSTQGTIRIPFGKNAALFTSLRFSYLNLLYRPILKIDDKYLNYSFGDINATYLHKIGDKHTLHIDLYSGIDHAKLEYQSKLSTEHTNQMPMGIIESILPTTTWGNLLGAIHWKYKFREGYLNQSLYYSGYENNFNVSGHYNISLPSKIFDIGYRSKVTFENWETGISIINHNTTPQTPEYHNNTINTDNSSYKQHTIEGSVHARYSGNIFKDFYYDAALKGDLYSDLRGYTTTALNPYAMIAYDTWRAGRIELCYSHQYQYLLNCGFTSLGMPVEFWISADAENKPQHAHNFQLAYKREVFNGKYDLNVEAYYKILYNQIEYNGSPLDILNKEYSLKNIIISGNGYNYGANIMLNKLTGKLTGWVSYSFGRAMRKFDIYGDKWFPASHERIHEVNMVVAYKIGKRFDIGSTFAYASGTPFTSVKYFYIMNNNILTEFGEHNANRLKDYIRLDVSANYDIIKKANRTAGINLSIYNVLCRKNEIYYGLKISNNGFKYQATSLLTTILPSISFYYKFD